MNLEKKDKTTELNWPVISIFILYILVSIFGMINHEMWRDELQAWMVARDASNLPELFANLKYEGNPALWHILLFVLTRFTDSPVAMQVLHLIISFSFILLFLKNSNLSLLHRFLFVFGYYIVFEYNIISRGYGLDILLIFSVLSLLDQKDKNQLFIFILLALLANTNIYGLIISGALAFIIVYNLFFPTQIADIEKQKKSRKRVVIKEKYRWPILKSSFYIGLTIFVIGVILSLIQIYPEPDNSFPVNYPLSLFDKEAFLNITPQLINSFIAIPDFTSTHFWNNNFFDWNTISYSNQLFWLIFFFSAISLLQYKKAFLFYLVAFCGLLIVFYYTGMGWWRYIGHIYIVYISAFWLQKYFEESQYQSKFIKTLAKFGRKITPIFITVILFIQLIGATIAYIKDYKQIFAAGELTSKYIKENQLEDLPIVANIDFAISTISGYLNKSLFYPSRKDYGSFVIWDGKRNDNVSFAEITSSIQDIITKRDSCLLILGVPISDANTGKVYYEGQLTTNTTFKFLKSFDKDIIVENEDHFIYLITKN